MSGIAELSTIAELPSPTGSNFSDVTAYEDEDEPVYPIGKKGEYSAVMVDDDPEGRGWRVASTVERKPRRRISSSIWAGGLLLAGGMAGWCARSGVRPAAPVRWVGHPTSRLPMDASEKCNPYEQHGVL